MKLVPMKMVYFQSGWNKFDFVLVWIGVAGFIMSLAAEANDEEGGGSKAMASSRIIRVARVLRTLRFLRIFRLFHARMSSDKFISIDLARHMKKVTVLDCFIRAHVEAQNELVKYFGGNGKLDEANESEIARCILQSQTVTYKALIEAAAVQEHLGLKLFTEVENLHKRKHITE